MPARYRRSRASTRWLVFIATGLFIALACTLVLDAAAAQVRIGIGAGGIGGILLNNALGAPHNQAATPDTEPAKKSAKPKAKKQAKNETKPARDSARDDAAAERRPPSEARPAAASTVGASSSEGASSKADRFGD